ncbi:acyclic terpene utilization AtuA family protein [Mesobacillus harenae]|uniref:acyclic terpene utilization AtuA family protein n=1 Tax=Mesobacillus harenae TaxID=2213203 RepID=UPI00157FFB8B|nr:acyclic terpene utilization AtuA family protein [Mesobacillus harenae]
MKSIRIVSPCGMLGYGFPKESFDRAFMQEIHGIVVDAGSTDAGPHKLGAGVSIVSKRAVKKDLEIMMGKGIPNKIPIIIGSAGGAGAKPHVENTLAIINEIIEERKYKVKLAVIWADFTQQEIIKAKQKGKIKPLSENIPPLSEEAINETPSIVAQMGHEPIVEALNEGVDIIICGRAYDPSPFAAIGIHSGMDAGLSYHLGKILECGALCAEPGTTKDSILGTIYENSFTVESLNPKRNCTTTSVAAHTFYEKEHPYYLHGPGFALDLSECRFIEEAPGIIKVENSKYKPAPTHMIKLEGARKIAYRTFVIAGIRDPLLLEKVEEVEKEVLAQVESYYPEIPKSDYKIHFYHYGKDAVLGKNEPATFNNHEIGVLFEVIAKSQELASSLCATLRSTYLHYGYEGRKSTAGNLAFPFAPSDVEFGPVYEFSIYHLMEVDKNPFRIEYMEVGCDGKVI